MVRKGRTDQSNQQVFVVEQLKETAGYVERMPGGVREGGRETSPYSIGFDMMKCRGRTFLQYQVQPSQSYLGGKCQNVGLPG